MRALNRALSEIELLTDDRKVIDNAFVNAASVYDSRYQQTESTTEAERAVQEFAFIRGLRACGGLRAESTRSTGWVSRPRPDFAKLNARPSPGIVWGRKIPYVG